MRAWALLAGAAVLSAAFVGVLLLPVPAAVGLWGSDQAAWSYYELVLDQPVPFPSVADIGYLWFTLAATAGLVVWLGSQSHQIVARGRDLRDGAIIAVALLLLLSWVTTLGTVASDPNVSGWTLVLSLAYPVGDLVLATLAMLALGRGTATERTTLAVLTLGVGGLALSDSAYVYLTSTEAYSSADLVTGGWVVGFLLVAAAGLGVRRASAVGTHATLPAAEPTVAKPSLLRLCLPSLPVVAAVVVLALSMLDSGAVYGIDLLLGLALVVLVLARQFLAMLDTTLLMSQLGVARDQLERQALHDSLTGLANRVLFADRLDRALLHPTANVSVLSATSTTSSWSNDELGTPDRSTSAATTRREAVAALLLRHADTAMYAAKGSGKGRAVLSTVQAERAGPGARGARVGLGAEKPPAPALAGGPAALAAGGGGGI